MIITNTQELKGLPITANSKFQMFESAIEMAEAATLPQLLGTTFYLEILGVYEAKGSGNDLQNKLIKLLQNIVKHFAYASALPSLTIRSDDNGVYIQSGENQKTPFEHQIANAQIAHLANGHLAIDMMMSFLEANKNDFTSYANSDAYTQYKSFFIYNVDLFQDLININRSASTFIALRSLMKQCQELMVLPFLGQPFYDELITQQKNGNLSPANSKAVTLVRKVVAHKTMADAFLALTVNVQADGYSIQSFMTDVVRRKPAPAELMVAKQKYHADLASLYMEQLRMLLYNNINDYTTFRNGPTYVAPDTGSGTTFNNNPDNAFYFAG